MPERRKLQTTMTDEQKELFSRYIDAVRGHQMTADCPILQNGFELGARIMLEVIDEYRYEFVYELYSETKGSKINIITDTVSVICISSIGLFWLHITVSISS